MNTLKVFTKREYVQDGERKVKFYCVGIVKMTDKGRVFLRLFREPEREFFLFPEKEKIVIDEN